MNTDIRLTKPQIDALLQIYSWRSEKYWWRPASMRRLASYGYVKRAGGTDRSPAWRITDSGRVMAQKLWEVRSNER